MRKPGADPEKVTEAVKRGAEALKGTGEFAGRVKPIAAEAADNVSKLLRESSRNSNVENIKGKGLAAGGAVVAADGIRRLAKKDEDGKRHWVRGASQTAIGVGLFTAAVINGRNKPGSDGPER